MAAARAISDAARDLESLKAVVPDTYLGAAESLNGQLQQVLELVATGRRFDAERALTELARNLELLDETVNATV